MIHYSEKEEAITGCSFNLTGDLQIRRLLQKAEDAGTIIQARDDVSLAKLKGFLKKVRSFTDVAFLVDTEKYPLSNRIGMIREQAALWRKNGGVVIGINLCGWHIKEWNRFFDDFITGLLHLNGTHEKLGLILFQHDTRNGIMCDLNTLNVFHRRLGGHIEVIGIPQHIQTGIDAKQAVRCCDILLIGRMHLAIAAHDQGVMTVSFGYHGKFEGFYNLYWMTKEWLVDYDNVNDLIQILKKALEQQEKLSTNILSYKNNNRFAANHNFEWI